MEKDKISLTCYYPKKKGKKADFSKKRVWKSDFYKCKVCGLIIFTTEKDKRNYEFIENRQVKQIKALVKFHRNMKKRKNAKKEKI